MRELTECKAEILRRSETRIHARRVRRNRLLAVCVPLCIALTVFAVTQFPETDAPPMTDGSVSLGGVSEPDGNDEQVQVLITTNVGDTAAPTDGNVIQSLRDALEPCFPDNGEEVDEGALTESAPESDKNVAAGGTARGTVYTVTFTEKDGTTAVYVLDGITLTDVTHHRTCTVTEAKLTQLTAQLQALL